MPTDQHQEGSAKRAQWPGTYAPEDREPLKDPDLRLGRRLLLAVPITWVLYSVIVWVQGIVSGADSDGVEWLDGFGGDSFGDGRVVWILVVLGFLFGEGDLGALLLLLGAAVLVVPLLGCYGFGARLVRGAWRKNNWPEKPDRRVHPALYDARRLRRIAFVVLLCWWSVIALPWSILSLVFDR